MRTETKLEKQEKCFILLDALSLYRPFFDNEAQENTYALVPFISQLINLSKSEELASIALHLVFFLKKNAPLGFEKHFAEKQVCFTKKISTRYFENFTLDELRKECADIEGFDNKKSLVISIQKNILNNAACWKIPAIKPASMGSIDKKSNDKLQARIKELKATEVSFFCDIDETTILHVNACDQLKGTSKLGLLNMAFIVWAQNLKSHLGDQTQFRFLTSRCNPLERFYICLRSMRAFFSQSAYEYPEECQTFSEIFAAVEDDLGQESFKKNSSKPLADTLTLLNKLSLKLESHSCQAIKDEINKRIRLLSMYSLTSESNLQKECEKYGLKIELKEESFCHKICIKDDKVLRAIKNKIEVIHKTILNYEIPKKLVVLIDDNEDELAFIEDASKILPDAQIPEDFQHTFRYLKEVQKRGTKVVGVKVNKGGEVDPDDLLTKIKTLVEIPKSALSL